MRSLYILAVCECHRLYVARPKTHTTTTVGAESVVIVTNLLESPPPDTLFYDGHVQGRTVNKQRYFRLDSRPSLTHERPGV
ncbi:hypothetical protein E2C01_012791 [Portunus trituberculatus]|uniref:Uncharacterized protein n=1 Tax=Portunus trituberculatus TaxID=210409 RepID=A0A5B7DET7_PORTR|nr:hypothetical protein [Portunus trituberculatus]